MWMHSPLEEMKQHVPLMMFPVGQSQVLWLLTRAKVARHWLQTDIEAQTAQLGMTWLQGMHKVFMRKVLLGHDYR
jgi:hypothetical protein